MFKIDASTKIVFSVSGNEHLVANENGDIVLENARIISPDPIDASHLSTKGYVDVGSTTLQSNINLKADKATTYTKTETDSHIQAIVGNAPSSLNTLEKIATQISNDEFAATDLTNVVTTKAPLASPTFTGTVSGITSSMVGAYTTTQVDSALALKAPLVSPIFSGIPTAPTPVSTDNSTQLATTAYVTNAVKVTSVSGRTGSVVLTKSDVGLGNVDNTSDLNKPVSTIQQTALDLKANQSTTYTKTETDTRIQAIVGAAPAALDTLVEIAAQLATDESAAATLTNTVALKAPIASPVFTGIPAVPTPSVGDSTSQIANTQFVITSIANALAVLDGGTY
jgi:hypothetical protein